MQRLEGDHALWKVTALKPDLVVMDLAMPILDGWAATREIKTHPKTKHIPVITHTGHATDENLDRARDAGADAVLTKPCLPATLFTEYGACQGCHGVSGGGSHGIPAIAATHRRAEFAAILRDFRENRREATVMGRIARGYSDEDIAALAAHYAARD